MRVTAADDRVAGVAPLGLGLLRYALLMPPFGRRSATGKDEIARGVLHLRTKTGVLRLRLQPASAYIQQRRRSLGRAAVSNWGFLSYGGFPLVPRLIREVPLYVNDACLNHYNKPARARLRGLVRNPAIPAELLRQLVGEQLKETRYALTFRKNWTAEQFDCGGHPPRPGGTCGRGSSGAHQPLSRG